MRSTRLLQQTLLLASLAGSSLPVAAAAPEPVPPLSVIIQNVLARDDATQKTLRSLQYHQSLKTEVLDENNRVTKQQELEMIVRPGAAQEIQVISEKGDDLPSNPDEATMQSQGQKAQKQKIDLSLKDLVNRFTVAYAGTGTIQNQPVYILSFTPRANQPYRNQTEKVLNQLQGRIWVSTRDYSILQTDASLAGPVEIAWFLAEIRTLTFHYELANTTGGMGPAHIQTSVRVAIPLLTIRQRMTVDIDRVEPRTKT